MKWALRSKGKTNGFTLVELLIVIVVIAILAAITIIAYNGITAKARTTVLQSDLSQSNTVLAAYNAENGNYPADQSTAVAAGLKASTGDTLTYTVNGSGYCLQASGWSQAYYITDSVSQPTSGSCPSAIPTVTYQGYSDGNQPGSGHTVIFTAPSGTQTGDLLIVFVRSDAGSATAPSGWTKDGSTTDVYTSTRYHKYATSSDTAGTTYTFTGPGSYAWGEMAQLRPSSAPSNTANDPFAVFASGSGSGSANAVLTTTSQAGVLLAWGGESGTTPGFAFSASPSASFTKVGDTNGSALSWASAAASTAYTVTTTVPTGSSAVLMTGIVTGS